MVQHLDIGYRCSEKHSAVVQWRDGGAVAIQYSGAVVDSSGKDILQLSYLEVVFEVKVTASPLTPAINHFRGRA